MATQPLHLQGVITDRLSNTPVSTVLVEAWDHEEKFPEILGNAISDKAGHFTLSFDHALIEKAFAGRPHKISLKLFYKGARLAFAPADQEILLDASAKPLALTIKTPQSYGGPDIYQHLPPDIRTELEGLKRHGEAVMSALGDEKKRQAFFQNPAQVLAEMGIAMSPQLRQRLSGPSSPQNTISPRAFRLLNGQIVTPKIKVNFTSGKKENSHAR